MSKIQTIKTILEGRDCMEIEVRTNMPSEYEDEYEDCLFGFCKVVGGIIIPLDDDYYDINEEVYKYEWKDKNHLTVWIKSEWI